MKLLLAALALLFALEGAWRGVEYAACRRSSADAPGAFDLFVVGESTARGSPYDRDAMSALATLVGSRFGGVVGGRSMLAVTIARSGQSIYPQSVALEKSLLCRDARRPGAALFYTANNDEGTVRGSSLLMRLSGLPRSRLFEAILHRLEEKNPRLRVRTVDTWEFHLRRAVAACRAAGVTPILAVPVSDQIAVDPGLLDPGSSDAELAALARRARELEGARRCSELDAFAAAESAQRPGAVAYLDYRRAKCAHRAGRFDEARRLYQAAVDGADRRNFGRATTTQVAVIRRIAAETGALLADARSPFEARSPHGLIGGELFVDGHHPNMDGYLVLADAYARALSEAFHEPLKPAPRSAAEGFAALSCDAPCQADAVSRGGWWYLTVSSNHPAPEERLDSARRRFRQALALHRDCFSARMGLALADDASRNGIMSDEGTLAWLGRMGVFFVGPRDLDEGRFHELVTRLRHDGASEQELAALERAYRFGIQSPHAH